MFVFPTQNAGRSLFPSNLCLSAGSREVPCSRKKGLAKDDDLYALRSGVAVVDKIGTSL